MARHGMRHTRIYTCWVNMRDRCSNPKRRDWKWYGALGISVCNEWDNDFLVFWKWAVEHGYSDNLELDRIDSRKNYEPENCRWITHAENMRNVKGQVRIFAFGEYKILSEWARDPRCKCSVATLRRRLRNGTSFTTAITTPPEQKDVVLGSERRIAEFTGKLSL